MKNLSLNLKKKATRGQLIFALHRLSDAIGEISADLYELVDGGINDEIKFSSDIDKGVFESLKKLQADIEYVSSFEDDSPSDKVRIAIPINGSIELPDNIEGEDVKKAISMLRGILTNYYDLDDQSDVECIEEFKR